MLLLDIWEDNRGLSSGGALPDHAPAVERTVRAGGAAEL